MSHLLKSKLLSRKTKETLYIMYLLRPACNLYILYLSYNSRRWVKNLISWNALLRKMYGPVYKSDTQVGERGQTNRYSNYIEIKSII